MVISSIILNCSPGSEVAIKDSITEFKGLSVEAILTGQLILLLEKETLEAAYQLINDKLATIAGVWGVYPVYIHCGST